MSTCDPENFVNREKELAYITDKIARLAKGDLFAPHERVIYFLGPSGIGKSCLLEASHNIISEDSKNKSISIKFNNLGAKSVKEFLIEIDAMLFNHLGGSPVRISEESLQIINKSVLAKLDRHLGDRVFVLFMDEIDNLSPEIRKEIEAHLLVDLIKKPRTLLVMAGRTKVYWSDFSLALKPTNTIVLSTFDEETTSKQVEKLRPGSAHLAGKIQELGGGVPGKNTKLVGDAVGDPPKIPDELQALQSLLVDIKQEIEERFHPLIEAVCIFPAFTPDDVAPLLESHPALGGQWDESRIREVFTDLNQTRVGPGGLINWDKKNWVVDEPTRQLFERELRMRDTELWKKLHCTAYRMCEKWGKEYNSQLYKDKATYHQQCLQSAGYDCSDLGNKG